MWKMCKTHKHKTDRLTSDSRLPLTADIARSHHRHHSSIAWISCYHSRHSQNLILLFPLHERRTRPVKCDAYLWDFRFSRRRVWSSEPSGMYCRVLKSMSIDFSEVDCPSTCHWPGSSPIVTHSPLVNTDHWTHVQPATLSSQAHSLSWWWRQRAPLKRRSISIWEHGSTSQKTLNFVTHIGYYSKSKSKAVPLPPCRQQGGEEYSSYSFLNPALDDVSGQRQARAELYPLGKDPLVPIVQEAGLAPEPVWTQRLDEKWLSSAGDQTS
jgi:hypothetical protein